MARLLGRITGILTGRRGGPEILRLPRRDESRLRLAQAEAQAVDDEALRLLDSAGSVAWKERAARAP
jgi:hypothetical protein